MTSEQINKERIRPIYCQLQGYLSQVPIVKHPRESLHESSIWIQYNQTVDELSTVSKRDYDSFKIESRMSEINMVPGMEPKHGTEYVNLLSYRQKLSGLISRLHGEFFSNEDYPFSGTPSTMISQVQQQSQSVHIQMLLEINSKIDQKLPEFTEGTKERTFLQKVKGSLSSIKDVVGLIGLLLNIAKECGLSIDQLKNIFV